MPGRLRALSGHAVASILADFGFARVGQTGSHLKLRRIGPMRERQTLVIPLHDALAQGTLRAIFRQASRYIPEDELRQHFFTE